MASSNRHWPSMFKTKACNSHHPWHHDINSSIISNNSSSSQKPPLSSSSGSSEETTSRSPPEPKPRWNPRPEQIRILESIFNSGTVNPSREEIRKIRGQLQEYGQVGDANVFYWFQNRKSRTKHKQQRHLHHLLNNKPTTKTTTTTTPPTTTSSTPPPPPPISSSLPLLDKCTTTTTTPQYYSLLNLPNFHQQNDFLKVPILPPLQGFSFPPPPAPADHHHLLDNCSSNFLLNDLLLGISSSGCKNGSEEEEEEKMMKIQQQLLSYEHHSTNTTTTTTVCPTPTSTTTTTTTNIAATLSNIHHTQCAGDTTGILQCPVKSSIVFINDVEFEVTMARPFNVREAFGDDAILIHASGQPVVTNEWGVALEPLHHGGFYYLIRTGLSPSHDLHNTTIT